MAAAPPILRRAPSALQQAAVSLFRSSLKHLRSFSVPASADRSPPAADGKRRKKKNLFEVVQFLPNWGIGYHMAKAHWKSVSYEITKINLYKDGKHGKAWGIAHKDGVAAEAPKKISGVHKRCWKYIPNVKKAQEKTAAALEG